MKNKEKIFWILAVIAIIIITTSVICILLTKDKNIKTVNSNSAQSENIVNEVEKTENILNENVNISQEDNSIEINDIEVEENDSIEPEQEENNSEEITKEEVEEIKTNEEKAIDIAKKDWGEDSKVVFINDGKSKSTGRYIVAVRDANTRNAICYYHIDINTGEFEVEN